MPNPSDIHPPGWWEPDYDYDDDPYPEDNEDEGDMEEYSDCGFDTELKRCHHAGSESCQFRCPYHDMFHKQIEEEIPF